MAKDPLGSTQPAAEEEPDDCNVTSKPGKQGPAGTNTGASARSTLTEIPGLTASSTRGAAKASIAGEEAPTPKGTGEVEGNIPTESPSPPTAKDCATHGSRSRL